ncbi:hypothetical protein AB205_0116760, partial [Aquarana catesbeiana]
GIKDSDNSPRIPGPPQVTSLRLKIAQAPRPPDELKEGEVEEVCDLSTPPSELLVVEGQAAEPFTTDSAQRLIGQIMLWNGQIDKMRDQIHSMQLRLDSMQQEMKNMIDVLGRI